MRRQLLLANEARYVLALKQDATPAEIKIAYRDMVKVWHPDRFGSDARLRVKAEEKLKQLNEAYRVLQAESETPVTEAERPGSQDSSWVSLAENDPARALRKAMRGRWILRCAAVVLVFGVGYAVVEHMPLHGATVSQGSVQQGGDSGVRAAPSTPGGAAVGSDGSLKGRMHTNRPDRPETAQFQVRTLSEEQTEELDEACSKFKESQDATAYPGCLKARLDRMRNGPNLSGMSDAERESMESACAEDRRLQGVDGYNRCLERFVKALAEAR
jgi:DnaJ domain